MSFSSPPNNAQYSSRPGGQQGQQSDNVFDQYDNYNTVKPEESPSDTSNTSTKHSALSFLKNLAPGKTTKDGQPAKRRGPKPDAKPAQTRRQELNRQAQRTHRERKEAYLKALETEVMRLREAFTIVTREKSNLADENRLLKEHMRLHGISWPPQDQQQQFESPPPPPPPPKDEDMTTLIHGDFESMGVDFVLALERPCVDHIQDLVLTSSNDPNGTTLNGHALMASCPPESHVLQNPNEPWGLKTHPLQPNELNTLLNMSQQLNIGGELTPVNAWAMIQNHPRFFELTRDDFSILKAELVPKIRCYGFGAVIEEYMVRDALSAVFAAKFAQQNQAYY